MRQSFNTAFRGSYGGYRREEKKGISAMESIIAVVVIVVTICEPTFAGKGRQTNTPAVITDLKSGYSEKSKDTNVRSDGTGIRGDPLKPPQNLDKGENNEPSLPFQEFYNLLKSVIEESKLTHHLHVKNFDKISDIFNSLSKEDKKSLMKIIKRMHRNRCLTQVITIVATLLSKKFPEHINFLDFLRFTEFVGIYVLEEAQRRNLANNGQQPFNTRLDDILNDIGNSAQTVEDIAKAYLQICKDIDLDVHNNGPLSPDFRNEPAAVYHYFKHRRVSGSDDELDVTEYYSLIRRHLNDLKRLKEYGSVVNSGGQLVYEVYLARYGRRFKLVVKVHGSDITLSSAYFVDDPVEEDKDGDVYIDGKKRQ